MAAIRLIGGGLSDLITAAPNGGTASYTWTQTEDGFICLKEVGVGYDAIIQASGRITLNIAGTPATAPGNGIALLAGTDYIGYDNLNIPIAKGAQITVSVVNNDTANSGSVQLLVNAYEATEKGAA